MLVTEEYYTTFQRITVQIIIIQGFYSGKGLHSAMQYKETQYGYNAMQDKKVRKTLLVRTYNLKGKGK